MRLFGFLRPKATITEQEIQRGLRWITIEGAVSMGFFSITTSGILVGYALELGADNFQIGVLAAIPFIMQIVQIPAIWVIEKVRRRKLIGLSAWLLAQLSWFPIALIPFFMGMPASGAAVLIGIMAFRGMMTSFNNASWNSWQRDLIPQNILGRFFSRRQAYATAFAAVFSLGSAFFIDHWKSAAQPGDLVYGYSYAILFGATFLGMSSVVFKSLIPEPLMQPVIGDQPSLFQRLAIPFRNANFRRLLQFLFYWSFTSNLAIPFFAAQMLQTLGIPVSGVIGLSILSQVFNIMFLKVWGPLADRFSSKAVLSIGISLYALVIDGWIFVTLPDRYFLTIPLLVVLHIFAGVASAAVSFTVGTIGLKLAPQDEATSYLATASLASNFGAGLGPIVGGVLANFFATRQLMFNFNWVDSGGEIFVPFFSLSGRDFLFAIAFILGLISLAVLARIREEGDVDRGVILDSLYNPIRQISRPMSSVPGMEFLTNAPLNFFKKVPIPGLDVALGVTVYQIAEMARTTASAAVRGQRITKKVGTGVARQIIRMGRSRRKIQRYGQEVIRHTVRGALHVYDDKDVKVDSLIQQVVEGVVSASEEVGIDSRDSVLGISHGVVQGAAETGIDITEAIKAAIREVKRSSGGIGLSEEEAEEVAVRGALSAAEQISPETVAEVVEAIPEDRLPKDDDEEDEDEKKDQVTGD